MEIQRYRFHKFNFIDRKLLFTCKLVAITLLEASNQTFASKPNGFTITGNSASNSICGEKDRNRKWKLYECFFSDFSLIMNVERFQLSWLNGSLSSWFRLHFECIYLKHVAFVIVLFFVGNFGFTRFRWDKAPMNYVCAPVSAKNTEGVHFGVARKTHISTNRTKCSPRCFVAFFVFQSMCVCMLFGFDRMQLSMCRRV